MPFDDDRFDLVLNRHEAYDMTEVHRILRPGGGFVTQPVDSRNFHESQQLFGGSPSYEGVTCIDPRNLANGTEHPSDSGSGHIATG